MLLLVTFTFQSFLIQTHIHALPQSIAAGASGSSASAPHDAKVPLDMDKCVLCQEYVHGGVYLMPSAVAALPPTAVVSLVRFAIAPSVAARAISHNWMGRAPPRA